MRQWAFFVAAIFVAAPAAAHPGFQFSPRLSINLNAIAFRSEDASAPAGDPRPLGPSPGLWSRSGEMPSLSFGLWRAEIGGVTDTSLVHEHFASYRLQGVDLLGASAPERMDPRSAKIVFVWPIGR
jgi:hypothetical protein